MIYNMKWYMAAVSMFLVTALASPTQSVAAEDPAMADSAPREEVNSQLSSSTLTHDVPIQPPIVVPSTAASSADVRDIPSIHGRYSLGGRMLLPYIGAGFAGGYGSEFNRSLNGAPPTQSDVGLRSQFGQSVSPNEFQLGVRIPF